jgi:hypothetical protein
VWEWEKNDNEVIFTTLHNIEVDHTEPLNYLQQIGKISNLASAEALQVLNSLEISSKEIKTEELTQIINKLKTKVEDTKNRTCAVM